MRSVDGGWPRSLNTASRRGGGLAGREGGKEGGKEGGREGGKEGGRDLGLLEVVKVAHEDVAAPVLELARGGVGPALLACRGRERKEGEKEGGREGGRKGGRKGEKEGGKSH